MATTIRDVVIRVKIEQLGDKLKAPKAGGGGGVSKQLAAQLKKQQQTIKSLQASIDKLRITQQTTANQQAKSASSIADRSIAIGEGLEQIGDGFFTIARGAAFLFSETDEGFGEMVKNIAAVQGSFDVFKGTLQSTKGVLQAFGIQNGPAGIVGVGLATLTGGLALGVSLFNRFSGAAERAKKKQEQLAASQKAYAAATKQLADVQREAEQRLNIADELFRQRDAIIQLTSGTNKLVAAEQRLALGRARLAELRSGAGGRFRQTAFGISGPAERGIFGLPAANRGEKPEAFFARLQAQNLLAQLRAAGLSQDPLEAARQLQQGDRFFAPGLSGRGGRFSRDRAGAFRRNNPLAPEIAVPERFRQGAAQFTLQDAQRRFDLEKRRLEIQQQRLQGIKDVVARERESLNAAKQRLKLEQETVKSQQAAAGRLSPGEQSRIRQLVKGLKSGTLNRSQLLELQQRGGGIQAVNQAVNRQFAQRGAGFANEISGLLGQPLTGQGSALAAQKEAVQDRKRALSALADSFAGDASSIQQNIRIMTKSFNDIAKEVEEAKKAVNANANKVKQVQAQVEQGQLIQKAF